MATQGVVSIVSEGKVVMKVVAGCDGMKARDTADQLLVAWPVNPEQAYETAINAGLGCNNCLTVVTESDILFKGDEVPSPLYRETLNNPEFNPRWERGTADHTIVIEV